MASGRHTQMRDGDLRVSNPIDHYACHPLSMTRRLFLARTGLATLGVATAGTGFPLLSARVDAAGPQLPTALPEGARGAAVLDTLPGKKPLLKLSYRPPNYETPIEYFRTAITPNDAFFVRYHLANIPQVDAANWKL